MGKRHLSLGQLDFALLAFMLVLIIFGVVMINSAVAGNEELSDLNTVKKQIQYAGMGLVLIFILSIMNYRYWKMLGWFFYISVGIILAVLLQTGDAAFGSNRWFSIGPISLQPSEFAKIALIVVLAAFLSSNNEKIGKFSTILFSSLIPAGLMALILQQPDLSTSVVMIVIWGIMLVANGAKWRHLILLGVLAIVAMVLVFPHLEEYQRNRVYNFISEDEEEARYGEKYNVVQSQIALGSGGAFGQGYQQGPQIQLHYLKVRHSDFIFSSIGEEFGFAGNVMVILMLGLLLWRVIRVAHSAPDLYGALICFGVAGQIFFHALINIGMNLNLMPVTGLPLPFVSYGGSALLSAMMGIGLVESVAVRRYLPERH